MQQVLDGAALGARLCGLGDCPLRGRVCLERRGHLLRVAVLGLVDLARLDGLLKLGEGLLKLLAVGRSAVLAQHTLAEERDLLLEKGAARVRHVAARRLLDPRIGHCLLLRPKLGGGAAQGCE